MLRYIATTMSGSRVAFTYVMKDYLDHPEAYPQYKKLRKILKRTNVLWLTGFDPETIGSYLEGLGFKVIEDIGEKEY